MASDGITPVFVKFSIPRGYRTPTPGQVVPILTYVGETVTMPGHIKLIDLFVGEEPTITLYRADDTITINQAQMFRTAVGTYQYNYSTTTAPVGGYSAVFRASYTLGAPPALVLLSKRIFLFTLR